MLIKTELDKLLREEFEKRGFYLVGSGPIELAPMPAIFKNHAAAEKFLKLESQDYEYVAYKNINAVVGTDNQNIIKACLFIKIGSRKREINPIADLAMFYQERLYKCTCECRNFFFEIGYVRSSEELKDATKEIWQCAEQVVYHWQHVVRTLVMENRWPEEEFISDVKFLED